MPGWPFRAEQRPVCFGCKAKLVEALVKNVGRDGQSSACSHERALWLRLLGCRALQFARAFVFFHVVSQQVSLYVCVGTVLVACGRKLQKGFRYVGTKGQVLHAPALAVKSHLRQKKAEGVESAAQAGLLETEWNRIRNTQVHVCIFKSCFLYKYVT